MSVARSIGILAAVLALGLAVTLTAIALRRGFEPSEERAPAAASADVAEVQRAILAALERIEAALVRIDERPRSLPATVPADATDDRIALPSPSDPDTNDDLQAVLREVRAMLADHVVAEREFREQSLSLGQLKSEKREADWVALDDLMRRWQVDQEGAKKDVKLLTFHDVVKAYGAPSEVWTNDGGSHWVYQRGFDADGKAIDEVYFRFNDGFVTVLGVK